MRGWVLALAGLVVLGAGAGAAYYILYQLPPATIAIQLADIVPGNFVMGKPTTCTLIGSIDNRTKFHIDKIAVEMAGLRVEAADLLAWSKTDRIKLGALPVKIENDRTCSALLDYIEAHAASAYTTRCALPGIAEGDCQKMVTFAVNVAGDKAAALLQLETLKLVEARDAVTAKMAPIDRALARLEGKPGMDQIMDVLLRADSKSWSGNSYDAGSAHSTGMIRGAPGSYAQTFHGLYTYNGGTKGWVNLTVYRDKNAVPCLEFHDAPGKCRPIHVPSSMEPAAAAPPTDPADPAAAAAEPDKVASATDDRPTAKPTKVAPAAKCDHPGRGKPSLECRGKPKPKRKAK